MEIQRTAVVKLSVPDERRDDLKRTMNTFRDAAQRFADRGWDGDDEKSSRELVALAHEEFESYDPSYYETQLVRAVESVLSPLGWDRNDIRRELNGTRVVGITDWT
ncbi:hypothetical protein SAMN04487946_12044 [Halobellus clavatus]|uniref:Uncharacterized protein n=1 Tax=Halobellus clavatus TaxID=660517 RepID=A0A1H3KM35_9EURY|nr:hypothetical protein SAMN04487946_12044 [Halobellus clavatus]